MEYVYEERIGNPDLFTGRKQELAYFLKWINDIKERKSMSTAILVTVSSLALQHLTPFNFFPI
jgi:hypothetical protein